MVVPLEIPHSTDGDHAVMSTAEISFVAAGAFSGFQELEAQRKEAIGFGRPPASNGAESISNFQGYGFLPERIAR